MKAKSLTRGAGILLSISSLPSAYGIGTFGNAAFRFIDLLADLKQKYWQVLPMGPITMGDSPFQSISVFAGNPYYIDLDDLIEEGLLKREEVVSHNWGNNQENVDYSILYRNRYHVLRTAYQRFDTESYDYITFCRENAFWLDDYSLFMAIKEQQEQKAWNEWEEDLKNRNPRCLAQCAETMKEETGFWSFCQYYFFKQWQTLRQYAAKHGVQMIGDMPFYVAYDSVDVWKHRNLFQLDDAGNMLRVAACPPDRFSEMGQVWGNPVYNWEEMERDGFAWWQQRMEEHAAMFDAVKLDHFIGVVKYFSIPAGENSLRHGKWVKGPGKKLADVLEKAACGKPIIAENMGTVLPTVNRLIQKLGWPDMKVLQFAFDGNADNEYLPHNYTDTNTVVYAGTHDNDTLMGYYRNQTEYEIAYLYSYLNIDKKEDIPDAYIRLAYSSIADVVIFQMQDILQLGNEARMNQPSTVGSNWKWRILEDALPEERRNWIRTQTALFRR